MTSNFSLPPSNFSEATLVQQTTADYLEQELGWDSIYAYNIEDFGPDSLLGRASDREVVLRRTLREKLVALNPGLPAAAYDDAVRQITTTIASQTLVATNREKYAQLRDGVQVTFRNDQGGRERQRLRVLDFDAPENNDFLCVRELWVKGDLYRRRADIIGFVNGLPLLFIECKNLHKNLKTAFEQNFCKR
ncbi:MAG: type I restriction endonuclease [Pseudomonadota bacterium]